jgi:hypothetical protein
MDPRSDSYGTPKTGGGTITNANLWRGVVADSQPARHACRQGGFARSDVGWRKRLASRCSRGVRPKKCPTAAIWAGRLHPTPNKSPTVLEQRLLRSIDLEDRKSGLLQDPKTGLPAYCQNDSEGEYVATMYPPVVIDNRSLKLFHSNDSTVWIATDERDFGLPRNPPVPD